MKIKLIIFICLYIPCLVFSQGLNNDFEYDRDDLNTLLNESGFVTFKFPVKQDTSQFCDFIIEKFIDGQLISERSIIVTAKKKFEDYGMNYLNYFKAGKDSIYFHRFYFIKKDTAATIRLKTHGYSTLEKLDNLGISLFNLRASEAIKDEIETKGFVLLDKPKDLMFLYANEKNSMEPLWCPSGLTKKDVIKRFHFVLFISMREYKMNR